MSYFVVVRVYFYYFLLRIECGRWIYSLVLRFIFHCLYWVLDIYYRVFDDFWNQGGF